MTQSIIRKRRFAWLFAALMTAAMFTVIALFLDMRYAVNDDTNLVRAFMGYETGTPASFHAFIHGLLALPLHWISCAFPGIAWFSWLQLGLLFLSCVVLSKSIMQCFVNHQKPLWLGAVAALVFLILFALRNCTHITYTQTTALLGAAAVSQMLSIDFENAKPRSVVCGMLGALICVALSYALRKESTLPTLAYCGLVFAYLYVRYYGFGKNAKRSPRPMILSLTLVVGTMLLLLGVRVLEIRANDAEDYMAWQDARIAVMDYDGLGDIPTDVLSEAGLSENTAALAGSLWFFLDKSITTEAFEQLLEYTRSHTDNSLSHRLNVAGQTLGNFARDNPGELYAIGLVLLLLLWFIALCARIRDRERLCFLLGTLLLFAGMIGYLAWLGRLPLRAMMFPLLMTAAILFSLLPSLMPQWREAKRLCVFWVAVPIIAGMLYAAGTLPGLLKTDDPEEEVANPIVDLYSYALSEPDVLFIHDITLAGDVRLFPDMSEGVPHNVSCWGGWPLRSKENIEQFANWDIDLMNFDPEVFLRSDVCFATCVLDPPPNHLLNYLHENVDPTIDWDLYGEYGYVYFFQFYIP